MTSRGPAWFEDLRGLLRGKARAQPIDRGVFEEGLRAVLSHRPELGGSGTVLEVGAGVGRATTMLAGRVQLPWTVHTFEPDPALAEALRARIKGEGLGARVQLFPSAIAEVETMVTLVPGGRQQPYPQVVTEAGSAGDRVMGVRLDAHLGRCGLTRVGLVVVDVGGHELRVLRTLTDFPLPVPVAVAYRPYALEACGQSAEGFLEQLRESGRLAFVEDGGTVVKAEGPAFDEQVARDGGALLFSPQFRAAG